MIVKLLSSRRTNRQRNFGGLFLFVLWFVYLLFDGGSYEIWLPLRLFLSTTTAADVIIIPEITISSDDFVNAAASFCVFVCIRLFGISCWLVSGNFFLAASFSHPPPFMGYTQHQEQRNKDQMVPKTARHAHCRQPQQPTKRIQTKNRLM